MTIPLASTLSTGVGPFAAVMAFGFLIGVYGHVIRSRTLIVTGIVIIGGVSAYIAFVLGKLGQ